MKLDNITKVFNDFELNVSLNINDGEIFGLIGKSGSGKSTILKIIQGIIRPDSGSVIHDESITTSYIFQEYNLLYNKTVFDNVALPLILTKKYSKEKILEVLRFVGIEDKKDLYPISLSGGEKQRVAIARALVSEPDLLLCDEVTAALDQIVKDDILDIFLKINEKYGTTILLVTHELDVAKKLCDRVAVVENGKILDILNVNKQRDDKKELSYLDYAKEVLSNG